MLKAKQINNLFINNSCHAKQEVDGCDVTGTSGLCEAVLFYYEGLYGLFMSNTWLF